MISKLPILEVVRKFADVEAVSFNVVGLGEVCPSVVVDGTKVVDGESVVPFSEVVSLPGLLVETIGTIDDRDPVDCGTVEPSCGVVLCPGSRVEMIGCSVDDLGVVLSSVPRVELRGSPVGRDPVDIEFIVEVSNIRL